MNHLVKADQLLALIRSGHHPLQLQGRKIREYPGVYSIRLPSGYRLLIRLGDRLKHRVVTHNEYDNLLQRNKTPL